ncbi:chemotaxis protein [Streptomyces sp. NBS 14/10]|uniref:baeRF3 domain-containing protein n=1 Tax=Streptomyces sp. NBS 14/10 TaxID=1945643 RepID=UPI000B7E945C|nr:chemotaxis protein [Streptomyces sp. NBS 14/10]KAK1182842.1 chemotaxis protein [Streptomyces sp. NBS 14/10]
MRTTGLTSRTLTALRARRSYPAVTITLPTHRREPYRPADTVRLRNLIAEAKRRLEEDPDVPREARYDISGQLDRAMADVDLRDALDSLVISAAKGEWEVWALPRTAPERVVFSDTFLTRNLVAARERTRPYWVLAVSVDRTALWRGSDGNLVEERTAGFPLEPEPTRNEDVEREERVGDVPGPYDDEGTRTYLRQVDTALDALLAADPRPLYLVGLAPALSLLEEVGSAAKAAVSKVVKGGLTNGPARALAEALRPALWEQAGRHTDRVVERIGQAQGRRAFAAGLEEVWQVCKEGRIELLAVEENYQRTVRVTGEHLTPVDPEEISPAELGTAVLEDIVDEIIETTLDRGGEVAFMPDGCLAAHERIAAVLRF